MSQEAPPSPHASIAAIGRPSVAPLTGNLSPGRLSVMPQQSLTSVPAICTQTAQELDSIWDEVGYSSAEKNAQIGALVDTIKNFCEMKVAEEKVRRTLGGFTNALDSHPQRNFFSPNPPCAPRNLTRAPPGGGRFPPLSQTFQLID